MCKGRPKDETFAALDALADAMLMLIYDNDMRKRFSLAGRKLVEDQPVNHGLVIKFWFQSRIPIVN